MDVILVGAGRLARDLVGLLEEAGWRVPYVLEDEPGRELLGRPVKSLSGHVGPEWDAVLAIGEPSARRNIVDERFASSPFHWRGFRHPNAFVSSYASVADGVFLNPYVTVADVVIERHAYVMPFTMIGSGARIGEFTRVSSHCTIASDVEIGDECLIGTGARIMAGVRIGDRCRIASNAVVRRNVPEGCIVTPTGAARAIGRQRVNRTGAT